MPTALEPVSEYDLIIVGAGVLGSAAARAFGGSGRRVLLLERDLSEPDRIVGELLQPGGVNALKQLGLEGKMAAGKGEYNSTEGTDTPTQRIDCIEGIDGIPCYGYAVFRNNEIVDIPYPVEKKADKQAVGKCFHHGRFIQRLREAASSTKKWVHGC